MHFKLYNSYLNSITIPSGFVLLDRPVRQALHALFLHGMASFGIILKFIAGKPFILGFFFQFLVNSLQRVDFGQISLYVIFHLGEFSVVLSHEFIKTRPISLVLLRLLPNLRLHVMDLPRVKKKPFPLLKLVFEMSILGSQIVVDIFKLIDVLGV